MGIMSILAALVLSTVGYARKKGALTRAETEIAAISAALENYKADNGIYVRDPTANTATDKLNARTDGNPMLSPVPPNPSGTTYPQTSLVLYRALSGDRNLDGVVNATDENFNIDGTTLSPPLAQLPKSYFAFNPASLLRADMSNPPSSSNPVSAIRDPLGFSYGYSTVNQADATKGYNPTFDLWSTAGLTSNPPSSGTNTITPQWIKNW
jgi:type II secretory pathway pseudopilin PulG